MLQRDCDVSASVVSIADQLKMMASDEYGIDLMNLNPEEKEKHRQSLIDFGNEMKGRYGEDFFVTIAMKVARSTGAEVIAVPDLRYIHEYRSFGTPHVVTMMASWRTIERRMGKDQYAIYSDGPALDRSEREWQHIRYDDLIYNDTDDMDSLRWRLRNVICGVIR